MPALRPVAPRALRGAPGLHGTAARRLAAAVLVAVVAALVAAPGLAQATVTIHALSITPSASSQSPSPQQAGAHPNVTVRMVLCNLVPGPCNATELQDDVNDLKLHMPPGLVTNPQAVPQCTNQALSGNNPCPSATIVGSAAATADLDDGTGSFSITDGSIYNMEPASSELARIGVVLRMGSTVVVRSIGTVSVRSTDNGIDAEFLALPKTVLGVPIRMRDISLTLNGVVGGRPFLTNPTTCQATSWGLDVSDNSGVFDTYSITAYAPNGCELLGFQPSLQITTGAAGQTGKDSHPPLRVLVTQPGEVAAIRRIQVTLPDALRPNVAAIVQRLCTTGQLAQGTCPASSKVGTATITTPLLASPLQGSIFLVHQGGGLLPRLSLVLDGVVSFRLDSSPSFNGTRSVHTFDGLPDFPITSLELNIAGGRSGILTANSSLCKGAPPSASVTFAGYNGKTVQQTVQPDVAGCSGAPISISRRSLKLTRRGVVRVRLTCAGGGSDCDGTLKLQATAGSSRKKARRRARPSRSRTRATARRRRARRGKVRTTYLGRRSFLIAAGRSATVKVKLTSRARAALRRLRRPRVKATASVIDAQTTAETIKLKVRKARRSTRRRR